MKRASILCTALTASLLALASLLHAQPASAQPAPTQGGTDLSSTATPQPAGASTGDQATDTPTGTNADEASSETKPGETKPGETKPEAKPAKAGPWSLAEEIGTPEWLYFTLEHRSRYEHMFNQFRAGRPGNGGLWSLRTSLRAELRFSPVRIGAELLDSRAYFGNEVVTPNTGITNAIALQQAYAALDLKDLLDKDDKLRLQAGRMTMDIGSRRLTARNRFRNTINAFTGIDAEYTNADNMHVRLFANLPIHRRPTDSAEVEDNKIVFDRESFDVIFGGLYFASPKLAYDMIIEAYTFGLFEQDHPDRPTRNRRIVTPGFRVYRKAEPGKIDFELESAFQAGVSRSSGSDDNVTDLDHLAMFQHGAVAYTFNTFMKPRFMLQYDYASGDVDPNDGANNRFDTLFGARRFELGPTGIYGAFARSNILSPGARVQLKPHKMVQGFFGWRAYWLAAPRDAWTTSGGVRDPRADRAGSFVGNQIEARVRFKPFPGNLLLEAGFAHLFPGPFLENAPNANPESNTTVLYTQLAGKL